ncbi:hypothetical protein WJX73_006686 [Symbiochloris irregularis]|uniref:Uncharacterized protein n=1 Tax=Symbiochloris irregularis TaxID=706552 RepID=A0AAW1NXE5_9CHLO
MEMCELISGFAPFEHDPQLTQADPLFNPNGSDELERRESDCKWALAAAKRNLESNPKLDELLAKYPGLNGKRTLQDPQHEELRRVLIEFRDARDTSQERLPACNDPKSPHFQYKATCLYMLSPCADSANTLQQVLARCMGAIVQTDKLAGMTTRERCAYAVEQQRLLLPDHHFNAEPQCALFMHPAAAAESRSHQSLRKAALALQASLYAAPAELSPKQEADLQRQEARFTKAFKAHCTK